LTFGSTDSIFEGTEIKTWAAIWKADAVTINTRLYIKEFGGSMTAYIIVLFLSRWILRADLDERWVLPVTLLPMIPIAFAAWAMMRAYRRMDELDQKVQLEALAFSFTGTALACVTYGFLQVAEAPPIQGFWVFVFMMVLMGIGRFFARRHYR